MYANKCVTLVQCLLKQSTYIYLQTAYRVTFNYCLKKHKPYLKCIFSEAFLSLKEMQPGLLYIVNDLCI